MPRLYYYNPDHDMALASDEDHYQPPMSAVVFGNDLSLLPCWYAETGSIVLSDSKLDDDALCADKVTIMPSLPDDISDDKLVIEPWGWDKIARKSLFLSGIKKEMLPTAEQLEKIRALSHRRIAAKALDYMRQRSGFSYPLPDNAVEITSIPELKTLANEHGTVVLKAPWSSSGHGIFFTGAKLSPSIEGWAKRIIEKQGCLMLEHAHNKVQDFAMEYKCTYGQTRFVGYSLFYTSTMGGYRGNKLLSNTAVELFLARYVSVDYIHWVQECLQAFISEYIAPFYNGYVGVDMLIYRESGNYAIHPAVEINVRTTMGLVARQIFESYIAPNAHGFFLIDHRPPGLLLADHLTRKNRNPLQLNSNGKIEHGYLSLCPITENTVYRAAIIL